MFRVKTGTDTQHIRGGKGRTTSRGAGGILSDSTEAPLFEEILQSSKTAFTQEEIRRQMSEIDRLGERLTNNPSIQNFDEYKKAVTKFISSAVSKAYEVETVRRRKPGTIEHMEYTVLNVIDRELESLLNLLQRNERERFKIINKVSAIKGMLVNLKR